MLSKLVLPSAPYLLVSKCKCRDEASVDSWNFTEIHDNLDITRVCKSPSRKSDETKQTAEYVT